MNRIGLIILLLLHVGIVFADPYKFSIQGKIEGLNEGKFTIQSMEKEELATTGIRNGSYQLNGELKEAGQYLIRINEFSFYCFLDGDKMTFSGTYKKLTSGDLKGSPSQDLYNAYYKMIAEKLGSKINAEMAIYRAALTSGDSVLADQKINLILKMEEQRYLLTKEFVKTNRDNIFSAYIADVVIDASYENGKELYAILSPGVQRSKYGRGLKQHVDDLKMSAIGAMSPDFQAKSEAGEMISLSSLKGKIVVLDFWASWCGPCIKEMVYLKKLYAGLEKEKIVFVSISLDDSSEAWKKACDKEQIPWISLHEEKGWKTSEIRKLYGINSIPFMVLMDEEGRIISKNVRRNALRDKIVELSKRKNTQKNNQQKIWKKQL